jgi:hypothetical protein
MPVRPEPEPSWLIDPVPFRYGLHNVLLVFALFSGTVYGNAILTFYRQSGDGTVMDRTVLASRAKAPHKVYRYTYFPGSDFDAGNTLDIDEVDLMPGNRIHKDAWTFRYEVNGETKSWSALGDCTYMLALCAISMILWFLAPVRAVLIPLGEAIRKGLR